MTHASAAQAGNKSKSSSAHTAQLAEEQPFDIPDDRSTKGGNVESYAFTSEEDAAPSARIVVDSGASHHFVNEAKWFTKMQSVTPRPIGIASDSKCVYATGMGTATVTVMSNGKPVELTLENALFAPSMPLSHWSVAVLNKKGYQVSFGTTCTVSRGDMPCLQVPLLSSSGLYEMSALPPEHPSA